MSKSNTNIFERKERQLVLFAAVSLCLACWQGEPVPMLAIYPPSFWKKFKGCQGVKARSKFSWDLRIKALQGCELPKQG